MTGLPPDIYEKWAALAKEAERREEQFIPQIDAAQREPGTCPQCSGPSPLNRDQSLGESGMKQALTLVYDICEWCQRENRILRTLSQSGVPSRVRSATFANYQTYDERQRDAARQIRAWIKDESKVFLLLLGSCGTGKGHLAAAASRAFVGKGIRWRTHDEFIGKCHSLDFHDREDYLDGLSKAGLLVFDEIGARSVTADTPERFYRVLDKRYDQGRKTILIGNVPLRSDGVSILSITGGERMESRIVESGVIVPCLWADYRKMSKSV